MRKFKAALLSFAHVHAFSYARVLRELPNVDFIAVWDDNDERGKSLQKQYHIGKYYSDLERLFKENKDLDFVVVTSENAKHYEHVKTALEHDVHVLCEKPLTTNLRHADELVSLAKRRGLKLGTCFVMRFHSATVQAYRILKEGKIGLPISITTTNHGTCPYKVARWFVEPELSYGARVSLKEGDPRFRGGSVTDHTVHCADLLRWFLGSEVEEVYAEVGANIRPSLEVEDNALVMLKFRNGVQASIDCSWSRPEGVYPTWGDVNLYIMGSDGVVEVEAFNQNVWFATWKTGRLVYSYWGTDVDKAMIAQFVRAIEEDSEPRASGWDGRQATEIMLATYESIKKSKPIRITLK